MKSGQFRYRLYPSLTRVRVQLVDARIDLASWRSVEYDLYGLGFVIGAARRFNGAVFVIDLEPAQHRTEAQVLAAIAKICLAADVRQADKPRLTSEDL